MGYSLTGPTTTSLVGAPSTETFDAGWGGNAGGGWGGIPGLTADQARWLQYQNQWNNANQQQQYNNLMGASSWNPYAASATLGTKLNNAMGIIGQTTLRNAKQTQKNRIIDKIQSLFQNIGTPFSSSNFEGPTVSVTPGKVWNGSQKVARIPYSNSPQGATGQVASQYNDLASSLANKSNTQLAYSGEGLESDQLLNSQMAGANLGRGSESISNRMLQANLSADLQKKMLEAQVLSELYPNGTFQGGSTYWPFV